MKLDSKECTEALLNYEVKNDDEKLAVKILLTRDEDVGNMPELINMDADELFKLTAVVLRIRIDLGVEEEA
jgi:hypothetical protein